MSLSEPERGTGSASNLPPSAERATSMPVARARRYVLAILRGRGRRPRPVGRACAGALAPGVALTGGCLAGKKPQDASESFIFRIIHPQQYTQSRTESIGVPALYTSTVGGRGRRYRVRTVRSCSSYVSFVVTRARGPDAVQSAVASLVRPTHRRRDPRPRTPSTLAPVPPKVLDALPTEP